MIIVTPLVNATVTGIATTCGASAIYDLGALEAGQKLYAGYHFLSTAAAGTGNPMTFNIFSASSSAGGFATGATLRFTATAGACRGYEWETPVAVPFTTCQKFYRGEWLTSCAGRKALVWVSRNCADPS